MSLDETFRAIVREEIRAALAQLHPAVGPGEYLTIGEAAELAHVSTGTIKNWMRAGRLGSTGTGRLRRIRSSDLRGLLDGGVRIREPEDSAEVIAARVLRSVGGK